MRLIFIISLFLSVNASSQRYVLGILKGSGIIGYSNYNLTCAGNSLTEGYLHYSYPAQLEDMMPGSVIFNGGQGGTTYNDMFAIFPYYVVPKYVIGENNIVVDWEIGNGIWYGISTDSTKNLIIRYYDSTSLYGWKRVVGTAPYRGFSGLNPAGDVQAVYNAKLDTVNNWLRANYALYADRIFDAAGDSLLNDFDNTTYRESDKVHYTDAGNTRIATLVKAIIITL